MASERLFSLLGKVVQTISLKKVAIWTLAAMFSIVVYTAYENRATLVNLIVHGKKPDVVSGTVPFIVSETSRNRVKAMIGNDDIVNAVIIMNADIRNNRRVPLFWHSEDVNVQKQLDSLFADRFGGLPLFTSDEKNNENIVGVINGEFSCGPYSQGGNTTVYPGLQNRFLFICRTSLPPYYGAFSGYITVALNRVPEPAELDKLKVETLNLSTDIYFRDVLPVALAKE